MNISDTMTKPLGGAAFQLFLSILFGNAWGRHGTSHRGNEEVIELGGVSRKCPMKDNYLVQLVVIVFRCNFVHVASTTIRQSAKSIFPNWPIDSANTNLHFVTMSDSEVAVSLIVGEQSL
jgi:hypothetical protein